MTKRQFSTLMLLTVIAGFLRGVVSDQLLYGGPSAAANAAGPGEVTATRFRLVDAAGKGLAYLGVDAKGDPQLGVYDAAGELRAGLSNSADGSFNLMMSDAAGNERAALGTLPDGTPGLGLGDAAGKLLWSAP